jgi:hypothetical protein
MLSLDFEIRKACDSCVSRYTPACPEDRSGCEKIQRIMLLYLEEIDEEESGQYARRAAGWS